jgi:hypothetical protein
LGARCRALALHAGKFHEVWRQTAHGVQCGTLSARMRGHIL